MILKKSKEPCEKVIRLLQSYKMKKNLASIAYLLISSCSKKYTLRYLNKNDLHNLCKTTDYVTILSF